MATLTIEELADMLQPNQPIAGLDLGTKTIGLSMSDLGRRFATPRTVLKRVKFTQDAETLLAFAAKENVAAFIIGLPMNMDGSSGPRVQATRAFVRAMSEKTDIPFVYWDERLSTVAAERASCPLMTETCAVCSTPSSDFAAVRVKTSMRPANRRCGAPANVDPGPVTCRPSCPPGRPCTDPR